MKILLVSGFLGAGKTSFIKFLSKKTGKNFVIIENEFAEEDVDSNILKQDNSNNSEMEIVSISEGCICCSMNLSFAHSVMTIANSLDPDYLIVEPSGVARPKKIIDDLSKIMYDRINLLVPILIVDGKNYQRAFEEFADLYPDELLKISRILVSKSEDLSLDDFGRIKNNLDIKSDNFLNYHYSNLSDNEIDHILNDKLVTTNRKDKLEIKVENTKARTKELKSISLTNLRDINPTQMVVLLERIIRGQSGDILRSKGVFKYNDNYFRYELVENDYIIGGLEKSSTKMVFIGTNYDEKAIRQILEK